MVTANRVDGIGQYSYMQSEIDNAEILITAPAIGEGWAWVVDQVVYGYSAVPGGSRILTVEMGGTAYVSIPVINGGSQEFTSVNALMGNSNEAVAVRLPASGVVGTEGFVNLMCHRHRLGNV